MGLRIHLDDWVWEEIIASLALRKEQLVDFDETQKAARMTELIRTLETTLGSKTVGGQRVTALTMKAQIQGKTVPVELRLPE